jgi:hypothetical protein
MRLQDSIQRGGCYRQHAFGHLVRNTPHKAIGTRHRNYQLHTNDVKTRTSVAPKDASFLTRPSDKMNSSVSPANPSADAATSSSPARFIAATMPSTCALICVSSSSFKSAAQGTERSARYHWNRPFTRNFTGSPALPHAPAPSFSSSLIVSNCFLGNQQGRETR